MNKSELIQVIQRAAAEDWEKLELQNQAFTSIPEEIGLLKKLRELHLLENQLVEVPPAIAELKELRVLSLARIALGLDKAERLAVVAPKDLVRQILNERRKSNSS